MTITYLISLRKSFMASTLLWQVKNSREVKEQTFAWSPFLNREKLLNRHRDWKTGNPGAAGRAGNSHRMGKRNQEGMQEGHRAPQSQASGSEIATGAWRAEPQVFGEVRNDPIGTELAAIIRPVLLGAGKEKDHCWASMIV